MHVTSHVIEHSESENQFKELPVELEKQNSVFGFNCCVNFRERKIQCDMAATTMNNPGYSSPGLTSQVTLTPQEQKEMEKFVKFLCQKMIQVIIQSRLGEKVSTQCKAHPSVSDWFNLGIEDFPEVNAETKKALKGQLLSIGSEPLCVEISLKTVEGDSLILENWSLSVSPSSEPLNRVTYTGVYTLYVITFTFHFHFSKKFLILIHLVFFPQCTAECLYC